MTSCAVLIRSGMEMAQQKYVLECIVRPDKRN